MARFNQETGKQLTLEEVVEQRLMSNFIACTLRIHMGSSAKASQVEVEQCMAEEAKGLIAEVYDFIKATES